MEIDVHSGKGYIAKMMVTRLYTVYFILSLVFEIAGQ